MQQLTYKGRNVDEIMARIAKRHGDSARIVAVDTSRTGGVLGFFQREEHVLVAEIVEDTPKDASSPSAMDYLSEAPTFLPSNLEELLARSEQEDEYERRRNVFDDEPATVHGLGRSMAQRMGSARSIEELLMNQAAETQDVFEVTNAPLAPKTFGEALENVTGSLGFPPPSMPTILSGESMDWAEHTLSTLDHDLAVPPEAAASEIGDQELMWCLHRAGYPAKLLAELASLGLEDATAERAFNIAPRPRALPDTAGALIAIIGPGPRAVELASIVARSIHAKETTIALVTQTRPPSNPPRGMKRTTGTKSTANPPRAATSTSPRPPSDDLAAMFASGFVARTLVEIADLSSGWRRDCIGVVAIACDMQVKSFEWTRKALRTLAPSYVGLVANASSKPEDLVMISSLIGGVDSLLIEGLNETMTPLTALSCDIPVSHLDGMTANANSWRDAFEATLDLDTRS